MDIDECDTIPCSHGTCENLEGSFACHCNPGYEGVSLMTLIFSNFELFRTFENYSTDLIHFSTTKYHRQCDKKDNQNKKQYFVQQ